MSIAHDFGLLFASLAYSSYEHYKGSEAYGRHLYKQMMAGRTLAPYDSQYFQRNRKVLLRGIEDELKRIGRAIVMLYPAIYFKRVGVLKKKLHPSEREYFYDDTGFIDSVRDSSHPGERSITITICGELCGGDNFGAEEVRQAQYDAIKKVLMEQREEFPIPTTIPKSKALYMCGTPCVMNRFVGNEDAEWFWDNHIYVRPPMIKRTPEEIEYFDKVAKRLLTLTAWALADLRDWGAIKSERSIVSPEFAIKCGMMPWADYIDLFREEVVNR